MRPPTPLALDDRTWSLVSRRWQTSAPIVLRDGEVLLCDPSWTPAELDAIRAHVARLGARRAHLVITHADEDHVCGIGAFPEAEVIAGHATAAAIADGSAAARLADARREWGLDWVGAPRVTRAVAPGPLVAGPFRLRALEAAGHAADGTAWLLEDERLLLPGDYLCDASPPLVLHSVDGFRATLRRLLDVLEEGAVDRVVPGHGPVLEAARAVALARDDLAYLDAVAAAAADAVARGLPPGDALVATWAAAAPPRAPIADLAVYDPRTQAARAALADRARAAPPPSARRAP